MAEAPTISSGEVAASLVALAKTLDATHRAAVLRALSGGKPWIFLVRQPEGYVAIEGSVRDRIPALGMLTDAIEGVHDYHRRLYAKQQGRGKILLPEGVEVSGGALPPGP